MLFEDGVGPGSYYHRGLGNSLVSDIAYSSIGESIMYRAVLASDKELREGIHGGVTSVGAFLNTAYDLRNGTQAQLGAVTWRARLVGNNLNVVVYNKIIFNSMLYHLPASVGIGDYDRKHWGGKYSDVHQYFKWKWKWR